MRRIGWVLAMVGFGCGPSDNTRCEWFVTDVTTCYDSHCNGDGAGTAFCGCWAEDNDLDITTCECAPLDLKRACDLIDLSGYEQGGFDCPAAQDALSNICDNG